MYYDIVFIVWGNNDPLRNLLGDGLGFLTDEIGGGAHITVCVR